MPTVANLSTPTWWNAYATNYSGEQAAARKASEKLYRADVPEAVTADYKGYVYAASGLLEAGGTVAVPERALYLKHADGSYFTLDFGDEAKVSLVDKSENLELYVYVTAGSAERWEFDKATGNMIGEDPTELSALEVSTIEKEYKVDIDFDSWTGANVEGNLAGEERGASLYKLNVLGTDVYAVGARLAPERKLDVNDFALMADESNLWEPDEDYDHFALNVRTVTIVDTPGQDAVVDENGEIVTPRVREVTHDEKRYDVYLTLDPDPDTNFEGETLRLTFDDNRVLIETGEDAPAYLGTADLARDEAVSKKDLNTDGAVGLNISTTAVDVTGELYSGSILGEDFFVFGKFGNHDSAVKGASLSGVLLEADGESAWEAYEGFSVATGIDTSYEDDAGSVVEQRTVLVQNDDNANEVLRFDFEVHTSALTDSNGNNITSFKLIEDENTGKELTPQELAAFEKTYKRDGDLDGNFGVGMAAAPIDAEGGLQLATSLGVQFLMATQRTVSSERRPLDLSTAFTLPGVGGAQGDSWLPDNVADLTSSNINLVATDDGAGNDIYEIYVEEDASTGGAFVRYSFDDAYELIEERYELTDDELAAAEVKHGRNLNADEYTFDGSTKASYGVVITETFADTKAGLYSAEFEGESMYIKSDVRLRVGSYTERKAVDFDSVLHDELGNVWDLNTFKLESDMRVTGAVQDGNSYHVFATSASDAGLVQRFTFEEDGTTGRWTLTGQGHDELLTLSELAAHESDHRKDLNGDDFKGATTVSIEDKTSGLAKVNMAGTELFVVEPNRRNLSRMELGLYSNELLDAWVPEESSYTSTVAAENPDDPNQLFVYVVNQPLDGNEPDYNNYSYSRYTFDATTGVYSQDSRVELDLVQLAEQEVATGRDINGDRSIGAKRSANIDRDGGLYATSIDGTTVYVMSDVRERAFDLGATAFLEANGEATWSGPHTGYDLATLVVDEGADANDDSDNSYAIYATVTDGGAAAGVKVYRFDAARQLVDSADIDSVTLGGVKGLVDLEVELGRDLNNDRAVGQLRDEKIDRKGGLYTTTVMGDTFYSIGANLRTGRTADTAIDLRMSLFDATGQNPWAPTNGYTVAGVVANTDDQGLIESYSVLSYSAATDANGDPEDVQETIWTVESHDDDNNPEALAYSVSKTADAVRLVELEKAERRDLSGDGVVGFTLNATANDAGTRDYFGVSKAKIFGDFTVFLAGENLTEGRRSNPLAQGNALLSEDASTPWSIEAGYQIVGAEVSADGNSRYVYGKLTTNETNTKAEFIQYTFNKETGVVQGGFEEISRHELMEREVAARSDLTADGNIGINVATLQEINNDQGKWTGLIQATVGTGGETITADDQNPSTQTYLMLKKDPRPNKGDLSASLLNEDGTAWEVPGVNFQIKGTHVSPWNPGDSNSHHYLDVYGYESADSAEIKRYRFEERWDEQHDPLFGNWVLKTDNYNAAADMNTRQLAEEEADAGKDLNGDGSIGFVYSGNAVASQSNGVTLGTANAKQATDVTGADSDIYIVGRNLDSMGTRTSNLANSAALFVDGGNGPQYWSPDAGFTVSEIWQSGNTVNLYAQNDAGTTLRYKFEQWDVNGAQTWMMASATRATEGMSGKSIVKDEVEARRDFDADGVVGLAIGTQAAAGIFNASVNDEDFLVIGSSLTSGTTSSPTNFEGVLTYHKENDGHFAWELPDSYNVLSVVRSGDNASVYISDTAVSDFDYSDVMPTVLKLEFGRSFQGNESYQFGPVDVFQAHSDTVLVDVSTLALSEGDEGYDSDAAVATRAAVVGSDDMIRFEVAARRDLDGDGIVGVKIDETPVADGVYSATIYDQTAILVSPNHVLQSGTASNPTSLAGSVLTNADDADPPEYSYWAAGDNQTVVAAVDSNGYSLYVKDTSDAENHVVKKYRLDAMEQNGVTQRILSDAEGDVEDLSGAALIQEEFDRRMDLDGDGAVGVRISDDAADHFSGELYKGFGLNDEVFYLRGYGLESGTTSNPLGLLAALEETDDDADGNPQYWRPAEGMTLDSFEKARNGTYSEVWSQALRDLVDDADTPEEERVPEGAFSAAIVTENGETSALFFDNENRLMAT